MKKVAKIRMVAKPSAAALRRLAKRRVLNAAGKVSGRVELPQPTRQLTAEQQAQLERIKKIREGVGPVGFSVTALVRSMREGGFFMPAPQKLHAKRKARRMAIPKPRRPLRPEERARFERTKAIRESLGAPRAPIAKLLREMRDQ